MSNDLRADLVAALVFAACSLSSDDSALWALPATWPWACTGRATILSPGSTMARLESHVVCHRHGALTHGRDRHRMGAHAVARDATQWAAWAARVVRDDRTALLSNQSTRQPKD